MAASTTRAVRGRIFISYRHEDTAYPAGWLYDRLASHFGKERVFKDVDNIRPGDDFVEVITTAVARCDVLLAVIGKRWLTVTDEQGQRRLDKPVDYVRLEIQAALERNIRVIPILVEGARIPEAGQLPASLVKLAHRNALELSPNRFSSDIGPLLEELERALAEVQAGDDRTRDEFQGLRSQPAAGEEQAGAPRIPRERAGSWLSRLKRADSGAVDAEAVRLSTVTVGRQLARMRHDGVVTAVAFSLDGERLATASHDQTARLWQVPTGTELAQMRHDASVTTVAFSPDGTRLATASGDRTARLWEVATGRQVALMQHNGPVTAVAFSPDGTRLATASGDRTARLWEVATGRQVALMQHNGPVTAVAFSPDGTRLATASGDRTARLWEVATGRQVALMQHNGPVTAVAFSADGTRLASVGSAAQLWEVSTGRELARTLVEEGWTQAVAFSPDLTRMATGRTDSRVLLWELATGRQLAKIEAGSSVTALAFSPDGTQLAIAGGETAYLREAATRRSLAVMDHGSLVVAVAFSPDGTQLATASADHTAWLWAISAGEAKIDRSDYLA